MVSIHLKLSLPDTLARDAESAGLLSPKVIEEILRREVSHNRVQQFFKNIDSLANTENSPLTEEQIETEIQAARAERFSSRARSR